VNPQNADENGGPTLAPPAPPAPRTVRARACRLGIASLALGLLSFLFGLCAAVPAIALAVVSLVRISRSRGRLWGSGVAVAGLMLAGVAALTVPRPAVLRPRVWINPIPCTDNLRNLSLGLFQYTLCSEGQMPPADHNVYLALGVHMGDATDTDAGGEHWRCPRDRFIPLDRREHWCSYAPNASVEETEEVIGAFSSNSELSNTINGIAPNTISFLEMWTPPNVVPGHPGFLLKLDRREPENWHRSMVEPGKELCAIRSYRVARPVTFDDRGRLVDCGNYLFLRAFIGEELKEMYHRGRINVAFIDGHVESMDIKDLIRTARPIDNPRWTRAAD